MVNTPRSRLDNSSPLEVFIIEDDPIMADCLALAVQSCHPDHRNIMVQTFTDALAATAALDSCIPNLIVLDILLTGPDGFTFLNELISYQDTARIPVIIVSSLDFAGEDLSSYGVRATLRKDLMTPRDLQTTIQTIFRTNQDLYQDTRHAK